MSFINTKCINWISFPPILLFLFDCCCTFNSFIYPSSHKRRKRKCTGISVLSLQQNSISEIFFISDPLEIQLVNFYVQTRGTESNFFYCISLWAKRTAMMMIIIFLALYWPVNLNFIPFLFSFFLVDFLNPFHSQACEVPQQSEYFHYKCDENGDLKCLPGKYALNDSLSLCWKKISLHERHKKKAGKGICVMFRFVNEDVIHKTDFASDRRSVAASSASMVKTANTVFHFQGVKMVFATIRLSAIVPKDTGVSFAMNVCLSFMCWTVFFMLYSSCTKILIYITL